MLDDVAKGLIRDGRSANTQRYKFREGGDGFTSAAESSALLSRQQCAIEMPSPSHPTVLEA